MTSSTVTKPASPAADTDPVASPAATPERTTVHWYRSRSAILRLALLAFVITLAWAAYCYPFSPHQFIDLDV